jgi:hypothetical protein
MASYTSAVRLLDGTSLRAIRLAIRSDVGSFAPPTDADPLLVELVNRPFESVTDAADRLSQLTKRLRAQGDRRSVFLTIYTRMTRDVLAGIEHGTFADPNWMREYVVTFANYYRRAFLAFERGDLEAVPDPWRIAFGTAIRGDALVVQDAFLGVNAHINYDLGLTLYDVGIDPNRAQKHADHRAINDILARLIDVQQTTLAEMYAAGIDNIDDVFGRFDESVTLCSMQEGRAQAWRTAVVLTDINMRPVESFARGMLRATATGGAFFIRSPQLDPTLLASLRAVETGRFDLDSVLKRLQERMEEVAITPTG